MKCKENLCICQVAKLKGYNNAAASRYYYALRLAIIAYFKQKEIRGETTSDRSTGLLTEKYRHDFLIDKADEYLKEDIPQIKNILFEAKKQREIGDYEDFPVDPTRFKIFQKKSKGIFRLILNGIRK
ncbi:MAG: hypothetical protein NTY09_12610 [bacterium]|nr:hypothetical protein [bacterium]